ncbi:MAG: PH domain-containing protein [Crocinitomix sp.]|nr:PH domain-containing protein [Crocinitomix sp.]
MIFTESTEINEYLNSGERLVWTGQPRGGIIFRKSDLFLIPFSLMWCGFAIFWVVMASNTGGMFALFGIPFVLVGLFVVFGRFLIDKKLREKTFYGITEDRIIIRSGIFSRTTKSFNLKTLTNLEFNERNDGSGTILLGPKNPRDPFGMSAGMSWWPGMKPTPGLDEIKNVREVYSIITKQNG